MEKITKRNIYTALVNFAQTGETPYFENANGERVEVTQEILLAFAQKEIEQLDKKTAKAKETAAKKRTEADELMKAVEAALTDEFETIADIAARVDFEGATVSKVTYRLTKLVETGVAEKTDVKVAATEDKKARTVKGYRLAAVEE